MAIQAILGFEHLADVFADRVEDVGVAVVDDAISQALEEHRRQMAATSALFVRPTTEFKTIYLTSTVTRNQPLDEFGRPRPIKPVGKYEVTFPLHDSGNAYGWNWQAGLKRTVEEVNRAIDTIINGDARWMFDHIQAALFANVAWTYHDDEHGDLSVVGLANGDAVEYHVFTGGDSGAIDTHYLAQLATIADGANNPFPAIFNDLDEHPENGSGQIIAFIPSNLRASVEALATYHPVADLNIRVGANNDELIGALGTPVPGRLIGYEDSGVWIVEWRRLVNDYIIAVHTGGPSPLAQREDELAQLRGFVEMPARADQPYYERSWLRKAGFGGWNRVGGLIYRIGNASYAIPTNFTSPMP